MLNEPDESYYLFGAKSLLERLRNVMKEIKGVREARDIEYVHRMRVASRRMRSALMLFEKCFPDKRLKNWNKQMRQITKALGAARDTDVQINFLQEFLNGLTEQRYRVGIQRLLLRSQQKRGGLQKRVIKAMDRLEVSGTLEEMGSVLRQICAQARMQHTVELWESSTKFAQAFTKLDEYTPYVYQQAYLAISLRLEEMLIYEPYVNQPERIEEHHAMRIADKRLRYTMEVFEPLYHGDLEQPLKMAREIQKMLGEIHDCDVWVQYLPQFLDEERMRTLEYYGHTRTLNRLKSGILYLQQERQQHRIERYQEFVVFWQQLRDQNFWDNLLERVLQPCSKPYELKV